MTFKINMTGHQASVFAGIAKAASKDQARPILTAINLEVDKEYARFWATDSYMLAWRDIDDTEQFSGKGTVMVPGAELAKTLKDYGMALKKGFPAGPLVEIVFDDKHVQVNCELLGRTTQIRLIEGTPPSYKQLIPDIEHRHFDAVLPAFDPSKFKQAIDASGLTKAQMHVPFKMRGVDHLKPFMIDMIDQQNGDFHALIMPVRVDHNEQTCEGCTIANAKKAILAGAALEAEEADAA